MCTTHMEVLYNFVMQEEKYLNFNISLIETSNVNQVAGHFCTASKYVYYCSQHSQDWVYSWG